MDQRPAVRLPSPGDHACRYAVDCGRAQRPANLAAYLIGLVVVQSRPTNARDPCETAGDRQIAGGDDQRHHKRSEEHTSELQSLLRISYAVFCLKKKKTTKDTEQKNKLKEIRN